MIGKSITFTTCTTLTLPTTMTKFKNDPTLKPITMIVSMSIIQDLHMIKMSTVR